MDGGSGRRRRWSPLAGPAPQPKALAVGNARSARPITHACFSGYLAAGTAPQPLGRGRKRSKLLQSLSNL